jgi:O-antigen ligase
MAAIGTGVKPPIWRADTLLFGLGICVVPVSIAVSEAFLAAALAVRILVVVRQRHISLPRVFWIWLMWAAAEAVCWFCSPDMRAGRGEMRHLLLIASLFFLVPSVNRISDRVAVWRGVLATGTISSLFLIGHFVWQRIYYHGPLDPVIYLRSGGLLHHWMVYATVEVMIFAAFLEMSRSYPRESAWLLPALMVNVVAIVLSLTRTLWICCLLILLIHMACRRSKWIWAVPVIPCTLFLIAPAAVKSRVLVSMHPDYYSNSERIQMLKVGWAMIRESPFTGIGPGRVDELYKEYLSPTDPVPAYHGHLHNNLVQIAAEFGVPATFTALGLVAALFWELRKACRIAASPDEEFLCRTGLLGLVGFLAVGLFEYSYGHSLGLILIGYAVLSALIPQGSHVPPLELSSPNTKWTHDGLRSRFLRPTRVPGVSSRALESAGSPLGSRDGRGRGGLPDSPEAIHGHGHIGG